MCLFPLERVWENTKSNHGIPHFPGEALQCNSWDLLQTLRCRQEKGHNFTGNLQVHEFRCDFLHSISIYAAFLPLKWFGFRAMKWGSFSAVVQPKYVTFQERPVKLNYSPEQCCNCQVSSLPFWQTHKDKDHWSTCCCCSTMHTAHS